MTVPIFFFFLETEKPIILLLEWQGLTHVDGTEESGVNQVRACVRNFDLLVCSIKESSGPQNQQVQ